MKQQQLDLDDQTLPPLKDSQDAQETPGATRASKAYPTADWPSVALRTAEDETERELLPTRETWSTALADWMAWRK